MAALSAAHADTQQVIARTDSKASLLLAFDGVLAAGAWTAGRELDPTVWLMVPAAVLLAGSISVLLWTVRPRLGDGRHGFPLWATLTADTLPDAMTEAGDAGEVVQLSRIAVRKMRLFRAAVDLTLAAGGLLAVALGAAALL
ncbi:hypothetical protein ABIE67_007895 [Streptomyces sp. V4I8]|uniref:Pycsar system effector family protein n=1 Tax=Streptomyces sp. V4I8 TaxID=3156469 RepID=UPI0035192DBF